MYVVAEHFGELEKFKDLIERGWRLRPDKAYAVSNVFDSLGKIYHKIGMTAGVSWKAVNPEHWAGDAADTFHDYFGSLTTHIDGDDPSLKALAENTSKTMARFSKALVKWRQGLADAIKIMAEHDEERAREMAQKQLNAALNVDPYSAAKDTLDALMTAWEHADAAGKDQENVLQAFASMQGYKLDDNEEEEVGYEGITAIDSWGGSLRPHGV